MQRVVLAVAMVCALGSIPGVAYQAQAPELARPDVHYVPTPQAVVDAMLKIANVTGKDVVYDLGCGDGRIPITAAQRQALIAGWLWINNITLWARQLFQHSQKPERISTR